MYCQSSSKLNAQIYARSYYINSFQINVGERNPFTEGMLVESHPLAAQVTNS